ncbi:glycoside hydrolase family 2 TIM barrel-domain containing protein [Streptomyces sp. NPDC005827]|uniref:glycoside hydrolase family 2 TIM barrel-domain containing protein n=1 Tax=Streptomyces sp. NPDC005827 TaxID=3157070 RepID=UPI0033C4A2A7
MNRRRSFNRGWAVKPKPNIWAQLTDPGAASQPVTLPHDALIGRPRTPEGSGRTAYFPPSGEYEYSKTFHVPESWSARRVSLEFQGAYRDAMVHLNDTRAAHWAYGYSTFTVPLDDLLVYGADNTVRVDVRTCDDSRWYSGAGLHRDVVLVVTGLVHISQDGIVVTTPDVDDERAVVEIAVPVTNAGLSTRTVTVEAEVADAQDNRVAHGTAPVTVRPGGTAVVRHRVYVREPRRWSMDDPCLHRVCVTLRDGSEALDRDTVPLGIRTLRLDPFHDLRINDEVVKLRGACLHHDNGVLGAAAIGRAEERRVELLKQAGFNAVRSAHNPLSQAMLDACDRLGMLVMDEAFDTWTQPKSPFDYATDFADWWERDIGAMVRKDRNHPSVVLYSIGNEIPETGSPFGAALGRQLAEKVRELDPTRPVTNAVNGFVSVLPDVIAMMKERATENGGAMDGGTMAGGVNAAGDTMSRVAESAAVAARVEESLSAVDIAGLNYAAGRYELDRDQYPNRITVGTETYPQGIARNWRLVQENPQVLGDFTWAGWDYLGEAGIGRRRYADESRTSSEAPYPWLTAWCGDLDITGHRRPQSYYRETVFGLRHEPYLAVERPCHHGREAVPAMSLWSWPDALASWTWPVEEKTPIDVEVYSSCDEVELRLNGRTVGRGPAGPDHEYRARFPLEYEPGELVAIAYRAGREEARTVLRTAGRATVLDVRADRTELTASCADLSFVTVELRDAEGVLVTGTDRRIEVAVSGAGVLQGLGTGRPDTDESFGASECTTFDGRALAVVRPSGEGRIEVTVRADGLSPVTRTLLVGPA